MNSRSTVADNNPERLIASGETLVSVTERIGDVILGRGRRWGWMIGFALGFLLLNVLLVSVLWLFAFGIGVWGVNVPVAWGYAIITFVWWIGIGHAGTLISAILLLLKQEWRTSINRFAEAMTLFAVACAAVYPLLHLGRPWFFYWLIPYPATTDVWPQFRSPLMWDFFAVLTYGTVSLLFWYQGLVPDLASMRDRARSRPARYAYGILALGWRNSLSHWRYYQKTYLFLAILATPLVVSVHTIVSFDFAVSIVPAWHSTVFPPYFVAGAIYCGFAMVLVIAIPLRRAYHLKGYITAAHLDKMAKVMLVAGFGVSYGYLMDFWVAWYRGNPLDSYIYGNRFSGPYAACYWGLIACNCVIPQILWFPFARRNTLILMGVALAVNIGMWLERFVIIALSLHRDHLPSSWARYYPTVWDWTLLLGTVGLFVTLLFLFVRLLPAISMAEMRALVSTEEERQ